MTPFKHILVPVDFSAASSAAIDLGVTLAKASDAELTLLHVWELPIYPYMEFMLNSAEFVSTIEEAAGKRLEETRRAVQQRFPSAKSQLMMGIPWQQILETVKQGPTDLLVMGTHGRQGLSHAVLGSVAEKIVRLSPIPVLTAHAPPHGIT